MGFGRVTVCFWLSDWRQVYRNITHVRCWPAYWRIGPVGAIPDQRCRSSHQCHCHDERLSGEGVLSTYRPGRSVHTHTADLGLHVLVVTLACLHCPREVYELT